MAYSREFAAFVQDALAEFGPVRIRSMFGGAGVFSGEAMIGLIAGDVLYLKADNVSAADFEAEGKQPFTYRGRAGGPRTMSYWEVPERLYEDPLELAEWARRAERVAYAKAPSKRGAG